MLDELFNTATASVSSSRLSVAKGDFRPAHAGCPREHSLYKNPVHAHLPGAQHKRGGVSFQRLLGRHTRLQHL